MQEYQLLVVMRSPAKVTQKPTADLLLFGVRPRYIFGFLVLYLLDACLRLGTWLLPVTWVLWGHIRPEQRENKKIQAACKDSTQKIHRHTLLMITDDLEGSPLYESILCFLGKSCIVYLLNLDFKKDFKEPKLASLWEHEQRFSGC